MAANKIKMTWQDRTFHTIILVLMALIFVVIAYPLYFIVVASFTKPSIVNNSTLLLWPQEFYLGGYQKTLEYTPLWVGYRNSIVYTLLQTLLSVTLTAITAYPLSMKELPYRRPIMFLFVFTMFFGGGLIPTYLLVSDLGIIDTIWAMLLPGALSVYNMIVCRSFFETIPGELREAALVDGCTPIKYFIYVLLPLSKAVLAVLALFYGSAKWNEYFSALIYMDSESKMPLQMVLRNLLLLEQVTNIGKGLDAQSAAAMRETAEQMKYCIIIASSLPLMIVYPFLQKHFAKGMMMGAVKG